MITKTITSKLPLRDKALSMTNPDGGEYLRFMSRIYKGESKIVAIYIEKGYPNHFNVLFEEGDSCSLPYKNSGCKGSGFGSKDYLMDVINNRHCWQRDHEENSYVQIISNN